MGPTLPPRRWQLAVLALALVTTAPCWATPTPGRIVRDRAKMTLPKESFAFSKNKLAGHTDPSFEGHHPAFQRLVKKGWFKDEQHINRLQGLSDKLKENRKLSLSRSLDDEVLAVDFEATERRSGSFDRKKGRFLAGWDEITEIGFTLYRNRKRVERVAIKVKPDVEISAEAARLTNLDAAKLAHAPRFEDPRVVNRLLEMLDGRPLIGQGLQKNDWAWLRSSLARLGVDLPKPKRMVLDTHLISYAVDGASEGTPRTLGALAKRYGITVDGELHGALVDAQTTAEVFFAQMKQAGAQTLGDAFRLMHEGHEVMRQAQELAKQQRQGAAQTPPQQ